MQEEVAARQEEVAARQEEVAAWLAEEAAPGQTRRHQRYRQTQWPCRVHGRAHVACCASCYAVRYRRPRCRHPRPHPGCEAAPVQHEACRGRGRTVGRQIGRCLSAALLACGGNRAGRKCTDSRSRSRDPHQCQPAPRCQISGLTGPRSVRGVLSRRAPTREARLAASARPS